MGTTGIQSFQNPVLFGHTAAEPAAFAAFGVRKPIYDSFQLARTQPMVQVSTQTKLWDSVTRFSLMRTLSAKAKEAGESAADRVQMYQQIYAALNREGKEHLKNLLKEGVLTDNSADDNHSTLYHLFSILASPRARGLKSENILNETVRILNKPYLITQKFPELKENIAKQILQVRNNPSLNRAGEPAPLKPLTREDLKVTFSSDCVPSSVMYYMADKKPSELARHLNELTSPLEAFYEKVLLTEISPEKPEEALEILKYYDIPFNKTGKDEVTVKVELPVAGKLRAINDSQRKNYGNARTGIEAAYQSALAYLPTRTYDPATGQRDAMESTIATIYQIKSLSDQEKQDLATILQNSKSPVKTQQAFMNRISTLNSKLTYAERTQLQEALQAQSRGLTEMEKTLLETIIKDNGGISSVTYQVVAGKAEPKPGEETQSYLYGYTRSFEQATADMIEALKMGEFVIIGITDTDSHGSIVGGHEITLTSAFVDKKDGEIKFVVVDSDDDIPTPVIRSARELMPRIHHAGLPNKLAKKINDEMAKVEGYFVPSQEDYAQFTPLDRTMDPLPSDAFAQPEPQAEPQPEATKPTQPAPTPAKQQEAQPAKPPVQAPIQQEIPQPVYQQPQITYMPVYPNMQYQMPQAPYYPTMNPFGMPTGYNYPMAYPAMYPAYPQNPFMPQGYPQGYQIPAGYQNPAYPMAS